MSAQAVLLPLFAQVALVFILMFRMMALRTRDLRGNVRWQDIALDEPNWPLSTTQTAHAFRNQFELPVLFYVLTVLALITRHADLIFVALAWVFVATRYVQAFVHITSNYVPLRGGAWGLGALVLMIMWIIFAVDVLVGF